MSETSKIPVDRLNSGVLFPNREDPNAFHGALNLEGVAYDLEVNLTTAKSSGRDMYSITGTQRDGAEQLTGLLFIEPEGPAKNGSDKPKPNFTGKLNIKIDREKTWRIAAWNKISAKNAPYMSLSVEIAKPKGQNQQQ